MNFPSAYLEVARKYERAIVLSSVLILVHLLSLTIRAQGKITVIEKNLRPLKTTTEITCIRHSTRRSEPEVTVPMDLEIGDELRSDNAVVTVKGRCGKAEFILRGLFRVRFLRSSNNSCNVYYYSKPGAQMNVKSSDPTSVKTGKGGETRLYSQLTQYEVKTTRTESMGLTRQWIVYEGEVGVQSRVFSKTVKEGEKLVATTNAIPSIRKITQEDIQEAATAYARIDVSQTNITSPEELANTFVKLQNLHQEVLTDPKNQLKREILTNERKRLFWLCSSL